MFDVAEEVSESKQTIDFTLIYKSLITKSNDILRRFFTEYSYFILKL